MTYVTWRFSGSDGEESVEFKLLELMDEEERRCLQ